MVGLQLIAVQQQDLLGLVTNQLFGKLFSVRKYRIGVGDVGFCELLLQSSVAALLGILVNPSEHPVPSVNRHGGDAIAARDQKSFGIPAGLQISTRIQVRVAE